jgi:hypothetical protein
VSISRFLIFAILFSQSGSPTLAQIMVVALVLIFGSKPHSFPWYDFRNSGRDSTQLTDRFMNINK